MPPLLRWPRMALRSIAFYVGGLFRSAREDQVLFLSSGIAFNGLLCVIPVLLLITSLLGIFLSSSRLPAQRVDEILNAVFPLQPYAQQIKVTIKGVLEDIIRFRSKFGISGLAVLVWTAASLFGSIRTVLNKIYRVKPTKFVLRRILENMALVILLGLLFLVANAFTWMIVYADSLLRELPGLESVHLSSSPKSIQSIMSYAAALVMFFVVNRYIPDTRVTPRVALIAAVTSTSLWWIAGKAFGWYLTAFHSYSKVYGTYAFFLVFVVWIYYSSIVFVVGAVIGQLHRERREKQSHSGRRR